MPISGAPDPVLTLTLRQALASLVMPAVKHVAAVVRIQLQAGQANMGSAGPGTARADPATGLWQRLAAAVGDPRAATRALNDVRADLNVGLQLARASCRMHPSRQTPRE